jgi:hypothetical protein
MKLPLALLDPFFYYYLKIPAIASADTSQAQHGQVCGLSQKAVRFGTTVRKLRKLNITDIDQDFVLFPYTTRIKLLRRI